MELLKRSLKTAFGLFIFSIGNYITMEANLGYTPWDALAQGIANKTPFSYGKIAVAVSLVIVLVDVLMKEKIGIGTLLDAVLVGTYIDIIRSIVTFPSFDSPLIGILILAVGMFIMAIGQAMYMNAGLGCGPRDSLLVAIGKRMPNVKIGFVDIIMKVVIIGISYLLGGPIGIGTLFAMIFMGLEMQLVFSILKFEPRDIKHEDIIQSFKNL